MHNIVKMTMKERGLAGIERVPYVFHVQKMD